MIMYLSLSLSIQVLEHDDTILFRSSGCKQKTREEIMKLTFFPSHSLYVYNQATYRSHQLNSIVIKYMRRLENRITLYVAHTFGNVDAGF
jgi:hypothetical protein